MHMEFDVKGFLNALGKKVEIAAFMGLSRTAPYGWERRGYLSSVTMAQLVDYSRRQKLDLDVNKFFVRRLGDAPVYRPKGGRKGKRNGRGS